MLAHDATILKKHLSLWVIVYDIPYNLGVLHIIQLCSTPIRTIIYKYETIGEETVHSYNKK